MTLVLAMSALGFASSHREAPVISRDPAADLSDFYAFVNPQNPNFVVFILNVNPLSDPGGGPNFHHFDDSVRYYIECDNEGDGIQDITYRIQTQTTYNYPNEFLYNLGAVDDPANLNITQTYTVLRIDDDLVPTNRWVIPPTSPAPVAPINVGVMSDGGYDPASTTVTALTSSYVQTVGAGNLTHKVFAGPRQEGFFVDLERTFDLLNLGGAGNTNTLLGKNVSSIAIQVHKSLLTKDYQNPSVVAQNNVIACWARTARPTTRTYDDVDGVPNDTGAYVHVARLGNPLVNEVVIPIGDKDLFNVSLPQDDAQFLGWVTDPILPIYMEAILGVPNPVSYNAGLGIGGREDLVLAFLTGHPDLGTLPGGYALGGPIPGEPGKVFGAFEALRIDLANPVSSFPNGRKPQDDVVDTALSAMAGLLIPGNGAVVPDGVDATGLAFLDGFPFLGDPWAGDDHPAGFHQLP
ncbi:MAG: DUF4331 domain-containing protein [Alphaproteobacteria bacterium]|nr:DUF4331 domain-containing protein [Alphaproteobacteria bacterium]MCB9696874.1 DUF4331 domain-containing protein [Alphaproteobacteria bacterium]